MIERNPHSHSQLIVDLWPETINFVHALHPNSMSRARHHRRNVPKQVHSTLKARAAQEGMSLSDFIKRELKRTAERPTMREWLARTQEAKPIPAERSAAQVVRELRDTR